MENVTKSCKYLIGQWTLKIMKNHEKINFFICSIAKIDAQMYLMQNEFFNSDVSR